MQKLSAALLGCALTLQPQPSWSQVLPSEAAAPLANAAPTDPATPSGQAIPAAKATLPAGTPLMVATLQNLTTNENQLGDPFRFVVVEDLVQDGTIVIPKGAQGTGEVTFVSNRGGFGKPGILQIKVVSLNVGDRTLPLDGRFRQEGANKAGATAATFFAVGIFAGFIKGKASGIERGRLLKARTAEPFEFVIGAPPPVVPDLPPPPPEATEGEGKDPAPSQPQASSN